jgi:signal transduction histidine kinase
MTHRQTAVVEDVYLDDRVPHDAYRPTFVKSLAIAPIRVSDPIGAIGAYWAAARKPSVREVTILEALASASAMAVHNAELLSDAHRAAHVREDFLAIASHELRTPLTSLLLHAGGLERALHGAATPEDLQTRLESIKQSGWRMERLLDRLLDATRMMRGRIVIAEGRLDLALLVRRVVEQFDDTAARAGSELRVSASDAVWILGDAQKLELVVSNLLSNAIKYGAGKPIDVTLEPAGEGAKLSVLDRGIGIAEKDQVRIFDPFERAVSTANYGGFGVGLWAARKMAEAHGGRIQVTSALGAGSLFVVEIAARMTEVPQAAM